jgi:hypothetical protein
VAHLKLVQRHAFEIVGQGLRLTLRACCAASPEGNPHLAECLDSFFT